MFHRWLSLFVSLVVVSALVAQPVPAKKVLSLADQDIWATANGLSLSPDGKFVAYLHNVPNLDGSIVLRNLASGNEVKIPTGTRTPAPGAPPPPADDEDQLPLPTPGTAVTAAAASTGVTGSPTFSPDSKFLYFPLLPVKAEVEKARAEKKPAAEMPKTVLSVVDVSSGQVVKKIEKAKSFRLVGEGAGLLALVMEAKPEVTPAPSEPAKPAPEKKDDDVLLQIVQAYSPTDQRQGRPGGAGGFPGASGAGTPRVTFGTDLVITNLADNTSATFENVQDYSFTKDNKFLLYTVNARKTELNGLFIAEATNAKSAAAIKSGVGRYYRFTWNEQQSQLAFFFDEKPTAPPPAPPRDPLDPTPAPLPDADSLSRKPKVFLWSREAAKPVDTKDVPVVAGGGSTTAGPVMGVPQAMELLGADVPGLKKGWQLVDRGGLSFSIDGKKLVISAAPIPELPPAPAVPATPPAPATNTAGPTFDMNLWHWKDEAIQPMQKVRAAADRNRSYGCVYLLDTKQFKHLADEDNSTAVPAFGDWGVTRNDKAYRGQTWNYPNPMDYAFTNIRTGETKALVKEMTGGANVSPNVKSAAWFDGKHWFSQSIPEGKIVNLTANLPVKFVDEQYDMPSIAPSYGITGWSTDDRFVFVNDRFDIWKIAVDGSGARNLTEVGRTSGVRLRLIRVEKPEEIEGEPDRGLDVTKPWLLGAENLTTRDSGFYRLPPGGKPGLLVMSARKYGVPTKAKKADTHIFTAQTFKDFPDYYVSGSDFKELKKFTDINPKVREYNWGTQELVEFKTTDGLPLQALLVKPENFDATKKYPMIIYIYERLTDTLHGFKAPTVTRGQVISPSFYASNGYLVLMPDIAYKNGQPGQSAVKCILPAIQAVVDKGYVNEKAIGINGQSWGGYQIAYLVTQTDRFKAAVAGAPVSNMVSAYNGIRWGTGLPRQFQYEHSQSRIGETLWGAPLKYLENSPIFMADRVNTPLMMIHNDADDAVPWYQGIEYYLALRRLGKEVYLLNYNGQPHNLTNRNAARDFAVRMFQFFEHHLKGEKMPVWMDTGVKYLDRDKEKDTVRNMWDAKEK